MEVSSATEAATWWEGPSWRKLRARIGVRPEVRLHDFRALFVTEGR